MLIGYGESVDSGFPTIIKVWKEQHWKILQLTATEILALSTAELEGEISNVSLQFISIKGSNKRFK